MNIKNKLLSAFELLMLFGSGIKGFSGSKRDGLLSFIIPAALMPVGFIFSVYYPPKGMETGFPLSQILATVGVQGLVSSALTIALTFALAKAFSRLEKVWLVFEAGNWVGLAGTIVTVPFMLAAVMGWFPREEMDRIFVIIQCYLYVVTGCIFSRAFQVNWQLAGFMAIATLFANQITWDIVFRFQGIPKPW